MTKKLHRPIITHLNPKSPEAEAFRILRTNLQFASFDKEIKKILFTSAGPEEGKSTIVSNFAVTLAHAHKKVLIIDCDLRKPVLHKIFNKSNLYGVTNVLADIKKPEEAVQETDIKNLFVLTSGPIPPNPAEILGSEKMADLINLLAENYDHILIDSPPAIAVTDSVLLSNKVDGTIIVVSAGHSKTEKIKEAKDRLEKANTKILGVVLNNVKYTKDEQYYYYYYGEDKK